MKFLSFRIAVPILLVLSCMLVSGCSRQEGPQRYDVSDNVILDGKPVEISSIIFTPDPDKGNTGPQGGATIAAGKYDTANQGCGIVGGPHIVEITAEDPNLKPKDAELSGGPLGRHRTEIDLPRENSSHDLI